MFSPLISNLINLDRYNLHKQNVFGVLNHFEDYLRGPENKI